MKKLILLSASLFIFLSFKSTDSRYAQREGFKDRSGTCEFFFKRFFWGRLSEHISKQPTKFGFVYPHFLDVPDALRETLFTNVGQSDTHRCSFRIRISPKCQIPIQIVSIPGK
jgi:hypothetical protein